MNERIIHLLLALFSVILLWRSSSFDWGFGVEFTGRDCPQNDGAVSLL
jgi:hypothetical protein